MSYVAIITKLTNVRKHSNADRLMLADAHGHQIVTGTDVIEGAVGIFFPTDGKLSEEYAKANDCVGYTDENGEKRGGFFAQNLRIRAQAFRGEKSDGYFAPLESLAFTGGDLSMLTEGTTLCEFNGIEICSKYYTPSTQRAMSAGGVLRKKREYKCFPKHVDTTQFRFVEDFPENSIIYITAKNHGTSGRSSYVYDEIPGKRTFKDRILRRPAKSTLGYVYLNGTRNVVMDDRHEGYYGNEQFRYDAVKGLEGRLHKGEIIYYELVGYTTTGQLIMGEQNIEKLKDKNISKQYGKTMTYKYGCQPGECRLYVYRIVQINEDGYSIDLSWPQVKKRCGELGLNYVPEMNFDPIVWHRGWQGNIDILRNSIQEVLDQPAILDNSHIEEGVVLRVEHENGVDFYKEKGFIFKCLEGIIKDQDNFVDLEEVS